MDRMSVPLPVRRPSAHDTPARSSRAFPAQFVPNFSVYLVQTQKQVILVGLPVTLAERRQPISAKLRVCTLSRRLSFRSGDCALVSIRRTGNRYVGSTFRQRRVHLLLILGPWGAGGEIGPYRRGTNFSANFELGSTSLLRFSSIANPSFSFAVGCEDV